MVSKGQATRQAILSHALDVAATLGLESLTIGRLASALGMSKSGLFAHFKSKEQLQLQVLAAAVDRFVQQVVRPAIREPRGEPRVRKMFKLWIELAKNQPGGCVIHSASSELDDRPGPVRDYLQGAHIDLRNTTRRAVQIGVDEGHFRKDLDVAQIAFEFSAIGYGYMSASRLMNDPDAERFAFTAFDALIERCRV